MKHSENNNSHPVLLLSFLYILICGQITGQSSVLYINEILASNASSDFDSGTQDYPDWIEIYNPGTTSYKLGGFYLSNDPDNRKMWKIPAGAELAAKSYLTFWADENDTPGHTNFSLNKENGFIGLYTETGVIVDSFSYGLQVRDISYGRVRNNEDQFAYFSRPTMGAPNDVTYYTSVSGLPSFSLKGGFYSGSQTIELSAASNTAVIYYTLNGKEPDTESLKYSSPITVNKTTALRARVVEPGCLPGLIITQTYLINEPVNLPVVSITTDSLNFFDNKIGIYVTGTNGIRGSCDTTKRNLNQDWERPVNVELYEKDGSQAFNQEAGIKIYGGCSRTRFPEKSLALYARKKYGQGSFDYQLFPDKKIYTFNSFVLRSSADDQVRTFVRDGLAQYIGLGIMDLDIQSYRPAVVFLNGIYWGIHDIREKISEHYLESNYHVNKSSVNILQSNYSVVYGTSSEYSSLVSFINSASLENKLTYNVVKSQIDIDQFIDYEILHIYLAERDWPGNNIKYWNSSEVNNRRWRWICFDLDQTFIRTNANTLADATATNGPNWPNPPWSTLFLRNLLNNQEFRNRFIQRYALYLSTVFKPADLEAKALQFKAVLEPEIPRHVQKWGGKIDPDAHESWTIPATFSSYDQWLKNYNDIISFIRQRPDYAITHLKSKFGLKGLAPVTVKENIPDAGNIYIYDRRVPVSGFSGSFFTDIPLLIRATPNPGYRFVQWEFFGSVSNNTQAAETYLTITGSQELRAVYEKIGLTDSVIIISEINYNSKPDEESGDWVELYNRQNAPVDLSGWKLRDSNDENEFVFPLNSIIAANGYMVICEKARDLVSQYNQLINYRGNTGFGFKNGGEVIRLFNPAGHLVDSVRYDNKYPWPELPDGKGYTLILKSPEMDNDIAENWTSQLKGSPGANNDLTTGIDDRTGINQNSLIQTYPNPCDVSTGLHYFVTVPGIIRLSVTDMHGRTLSTLINSFRETGRYEFILNTEKYDPGLYICTLETNGKYSGSVIFIVAH